MKDDQEGDFAAGQEAEHPEGQEEKEHGGEKEHTGTFAEGQDEHEH